MRQTSGTARTAASTLTGKNPSPRKIRKVWPAPMANALLRARVSEVSSLPDQRTSRLPEASQKASPKRIRGTAPTSASWRSSTVLMKCDCPKMKLASSGLTMGTTVSSMAALLQDELRKFMVGRRKVIASRHRRPISPVEQRRRCSNVTALGLRHYCRRLRKRKRPPTEAVLLPGYAAALFTHERVVSVNLASKSRPAASENFQSMGFSLTLRQFHQATTFC